MTRKRIALNIILGIIAVILILGIAYGSFFVFKIYQTGNKVTLFPQGDKSILNTLKSFSPQPEIDLRGMGKDRINILLLGVAGKGKPGQNLTDTIMIASVNPKTNQVALLSIPRDLYVKIPDMDVFMKINSVYQWSLNNRKSENDSAQTLEKIMTNITGQDINYYVILNFDGFTKIIDTIGGINVMNERDLYDPTYPGPNYSYETFKLDKGFQHLDGATALKYARERHNDPEGDFGRAKRQQQILQATKSKVFSAGTMLNVFKVNEIFNALGDNVRTDISPDEFESFWELAKKADTNNINNVVVDAWNKDSLLKVSHVYFGDKGERAFILVPRVSNWSEIQELAQSIFDLNTIKRRKDEIAKENATVTIINKSGYAPLSDKIKSLLSDNFDYKNVIVLNSFGKDTEETTRVYDITKGTKPFTLDELIGKLPASPAENLSTDYRKIIQNISPDLVVVLGKDIVSKYNMEEDSFEEYNKSSDTNEYTEFLNQ